MALKLFYRQIRQLRGQRNVSISAILNKKEDFIIKSTLQDIVIPQTRFVDRLWIDSANFKNHIALECAETKKTYTYKQIQQFSAIFATSLHKKLGLRQGDMVCAILPNCPEFAVVALGTLQAGCILTTYNPIYKEIEISHQISTTEPKVIVTIPECYDIVIKALKIAKRDAKIVIIDRPNTLINAGVIKYTEIAESGEIDNKMLDKVEPKLEDVAVIPFSSGTTGLPKGVEITYKNILAALELMTNKANCYPELTHGDFQDIVPCILPFFHIYGFVISLLGHLQKGCKLVTMSKFSASLFFEILKKQDVSLLYLVPPIVMLLGKHPDVKPEHIQNVRHIVCGAAPLSASDVEPVLKKSNGKLQFSQGFGTTETTSLATATFIGKKIEDYSACGEPLASTELKFIDPQTGKAVSIGESGEMCIRGPSIMKGYHRNEAATKESLMGDGFYRTGDMGHYKPGTGVFITDRIKELIKVKGMQVAPAELEGILRSHPAVQDAAVIGIPHMFYGEVPKALVIQKKGQCASPEEIQTFVANKVAPYKKIEEIMFIEDIPKTASGKILRKELKKMYA